MQNSNIQDDKKTGGQWNRPEDKKDTQMMSSGPMEQDKKNGSHEKPEDKEKKAPSSIFRGRDF